MLIQLISNFFLNIFLSGGKTTRTCTQGTNGKIEIETGIFSEFCIA